VELTTSEKPGMTSSEISRDNRRLKRPIALASPTWRSMPAFPPSIVPASDWSLKRPVQPWQRALSAPKLLQRRPLLEALQLQQNSMGRRQVDQFRHAADLQLLHQRRSPHLDRSLADEQPRRH